VAEGGRIALLGWKTLPGGRPSGTSLLSLRGGITIMAAKKKAKKTAKKAAKKTAKKKK
jgi:hypothetical protein